MNQTLIQEILNENYMQRKLKNPSFSIRAFSQRLGVNHSALCEIMSGKRKVGRKLANRLADGLMVDAEVREMLLTSNAKKSNSKDIRKFSQLRADQYKVISDWYHFAILSLIETRGFKNDPEWIAKRLRVTKTEVREALQRLERLELIAVNGSKLISTGKAFTSPDGKIDLAVRKTHSQYLDLAHKSLEAVEIERRDFTAITMAIDPQKIPEAKQRIRQFRDELCAFLEDRNQKEVYEMCFQLFPLTHEV